MGATALGIKSAVNKTTAEALAAVWTNTTNSKSPDDKLVEAFVEMVQDAGGCAPLNIPVSAHFKGFLEVVEADKPKEVIKKLWEISSTAVNEMWLARNELGKVVRKDTSQYHIYLSRRCSMRGSWHTSISHVMK